MFTVTNRLISPICAKAPALPSSRPVAAYSRYIHRSVFKGPCRQFSASLPKGENRFNYLFYVIAAVCTGLLFCAERKKKAISEEKLIEKFTKNESRLFEAVCLASKAIDYDNPCHELRQNAYEYSPWSLNRAILALCGKKEFLGSEGEINYALLGRLIATVDATLKDPVLHEGLETRWVDLCIYQQINELSNKSIATHLMHPRTVLIQRLIELWYVLQLKDDERSLYWMTSRELYPHVYGEYRHTAPFWIQTIPLLNAALLIKLSTSENFSDRESLINQVIPKLIEHHQSFSYGSVYSLPHIIAGVVQETHLPEQKARNRVAIDALHFSGILSNPHFREEHRNDWFKLLLEGKFGGKSEEWLDALVRLHNKEETPEERRREIQSVLEKEARFISANSRTAKAALLRLNV